MRYSMHSSQPYPIKLQPHLALSLFNDNTGGGWLSWSSKTSRLQRDHVDIVFCYSDLRIVHKAVLNMATVPSLRVSVFRRLEISYSLSDDIVDRPAGHVMYIIVFYII